MSIHSSVFEVEALRSGHIPLEFPDAHECSLRRCSADKLDLAVVAVAEGSSMRSGCPVVVENPVEICTAHVDTGICS